MLPYHTGRVQTNSILKHRGCCWIASVIANSAWPHRRQPTRLRCPWILQARTLEWVAISFSNAWKWKWSHPVVSDSANTWAAAHQAPPSIGFSRRECWSGSPLPSPNTEAAWLNFQKHQVSERVSCYQPLALPYVTKQGANRSGGQESKGKWVWGSRLTNTVKKWKQNVWAR